MPTLQEQVGGLSQEALDIFKQQLPQRLKELGELERNTALEQLRGIPGLGLEDFRPSPIQPQQQVQPQQLPQQAPQQQPQQPQEDIPWWQHPLEWIRTAEQAAGTFLAAPFTPPVPGTENLPWWQRERAEYEAWNEPSFQVEPLFRLPWTSQEIRDKPWLLLR